MAANGTVFYFETNFDHVPVHAWMVGHWTLCFYFAGAYLLLVFLGRRCLEDRRGFRLQRALLVWNLTLATFSLVGACRMLSEAASSVLLFGFRYSVCDKGFVAGTSGLWVWLFALSKLPELGDTAFLVLRKRPVSFLHWYHHATVLCYVWYSYASIASTGRWFAAINYSVHALMYSYYALRAWGVRVPALVSAVITALQLMQMVVGCFLTVWGYRAKSRGEPCGVSDENLMASLLMYLSYLMLFAHFFYASYMVKSPTRRKTE